MALADQQRRAGPDFCLKHRGRKIWIEAVVATNGQDGHPDQVPDFPYDGVMRGIPSNKIDLRLTNAFETKSQKFTGYREQGIVAQDDISIIAIHPGKLAHLTDLEGRLSPWSTLYPFGDQYISFAPDSNDSESGYHRRNFVTKSNDATVPIGTFANGQHSHISCVIWSNTVNLVSNEVIDLAMFHNPEAKQRLPIGWLDWATEWKGELNEDGLSATLTKVE